MVSHLDLNRGHVGKGGTGEEGAGKSGNTNRLHVGGECREINESEGTEGGSVGKYVV